MGFGTERDCHLTFGYDFDERFAYEFEVKNVKKISRYNFITANYRLSNKAIEFDQFRFFVKMYQINIQNMLNHCAARLNTISKTTST